jgi:hypothetical protein
MLPRGFKYAIFRLQRPNWVPAWEFEDAVNILRAARAMADLVPNDLERDSENGFWLLRVSTAETKECWLRFRWNEPDASYLRVVVRDRR